MKEPALKPPPSKIGDLRVRARAYQDSSSVWLLHIPCS